MAALLFGLSTSSRAQIPGGGGPEILPVVVLRAGDAEASEPGSNIGRFEIFRDGPTNEALFISLEIGGTASPGLDYTNLPTWVSIPAGVRGVPLIVRPVDDDVAEGPETVSVRLFYPPLASPLPPNYVIGTASNAVVTIYDNEPPPTNLPAIVTIVASDPEAAEPGVATVINDGQFTLLRTGPTDLALPVLLRIAGTASNGVDYAPLAKTVVIPIGESSTRIRVTALFDLLPEPTEAVVIQLETPVCIAIYPPPRECYEVGLPAEAVVKILDNRLAPRPVVRIEARDPEATEIPEVPPWSDQPQRVDPAVFVVTRTGDTNLPLDVFYAVSGTASNGVDYLRLPGRVTIPSGRESAAIEVLTIDDFAVEGTESIVLKLLPPACTNTDPPPGGCYHTGSPAEAAAKLLDNDLLPTNRPPEVKLTKPLDGQTFTLPAKVPFRADAVDADGYVPHMEFYAGEVKIGEVTRMFFVPPPPGQHHVYEFTWTNPPVGRHVLRAKAQDDAGAFGWSAPVTIWVVQTNEPPTTNRPTVVTFTAPDPVASEGTNCLRWPDWPIVAGANFKGTNTALFVIRRSGPTNDPLPVFYHIGGTASNGVDYVELPGRVTIPAGRRAAEFKVVPLDDTLPERLETVVLGLRVPPETAVNVPPYLVGYPNRAAAVIADNDQPRPITSILPDRCFHIMRPGEDGGWYRVEWSSDLVNWTALGTNQVVEGALHFVDADADDSVQRFYRAVPAPAPAPE